MAKGVCPTCRSTDIEYLGSEPVDESVKYGARCRACNTEFTEWYDLVYSETIKH